MKLRPLLLSVALVARASSAVAADDLVTAEAKLRMAEGKKLYGDGKYEAAWLKYVEACVVLRTDGCTRGLAFTAYKSGRYLAAYGYSKQLLEPAPRASLSPAVVDELARMKGDAYAKVGHLAIAAPAGAIVVLDEEMIGRAPLADVVDVDAAEHTVVANVRGHAMTARVIAVAGAVTSVRFDEPPSVAEPAPVAASPALPTTTSALAPWAPLDAPVEPPRANPWRTWVPVGLGIGALALAGGGVYFGARSHRDSADAARLRSGLPSDACLDPTQGSCGAIADDVHAADRARATSVVLYAGAGALAAGAALSFLLIPKSAGGRSAFVPITDRSTLGAGWVTTF